MKKSFFQFVLRTALHLTGVSTLFLLSTLVFVSPARAALTLTSGSNATTTPNVATAITGFQVVGPSASTTPVQLRVTNGSLSFSVTTGLTFSTPSIGSTVAFTGTVSDINAALSTLRYTRATTGTDTLEISLVNNGEIFFTENNHLYQYVAGSYTWSAAKSAAEAMTAYGASGYLATITSSTENDFVYQRILGDGWLGATDAGVEDTWEWATGPETGTAFYSGRGGLGGSAISGRYNGWANNEPNDFGAGEDCGYMYASQDGEWNDFPCSATQGFVVEFGAPGDLPTVVATNVSIVTADVPAVTQLTPANGATSVSPTANLVIEFSKTVTTSTGNILLKKGSDDSTVESIAVNGTQVTGSGTDTITVNPSITLDDLTEYYVIIPSTAFLDEDLNAFEGISSSSTWAFTTNDLNAPVITNIATSTVSTSTATITWDTSEDASSKVVYGTTSDLGRTTTETNTSVRVDSHSVSLSSLLPCTSYRFSVVSRDSSLNSTTSTSDGFITTGCTADAIPGATTSTNITVASGGTTSVEEADQSLAVTLPVNATVSSSSIVIQIKAVAKEDVLSEIGRPTSLPYEVGSIVFDVKAIIDNTTVLDSFDQEVTITYTYRDADIVGLDESSLRLYHYHDNAWVALNNCSLNTHTNTISCTTPSFSIFGLFGTVPVAQRTVSNGIPWSHVEPKLLPAVPPFILNNDNSDSPETTSPAVALTFNVDRATVKGHAASLSPTGTTSIHPLEINTFHLPSSYGVYRIYLTYYSITGKPSATFSRLIRYVPVKSVSPIESPRVTTTSRSPETTFARPLKFGSIGEDVRRLQRFLNERGFLIKSSGPGSPNNESIVFGSLTAAALRRFQEAHRASILTPLGLQRGTGIFGSSTLMFVNALLKK